MPEGRLPVRQVLAARARPPVITPHLPQHSRLQPARLERQQAGRLQRGHRGALRLLLGVAEGAALEGAAAVVQGGVLGFEAGSGRVPGVGACLQGGARRGVTGCGCACEGLHARGVRQMHW